MRRAEIVRAIERVRENIERTGIKDRLQEVLRRDKSHENREPLVRALRDYTLAAHATYGDPERALTNIFGLDELEDVKVWFRLLATETDHPNVRETAMSLFYAVRFVTDNLDQIRKLLVTEGVEAELEPKKEFEASGETWATLSIFLIEDDKRVSRPARLIDALQSIADLYEAYAVILNYPADSLSVIGCDSGSDKSFDFLGIAKGLDAVRQLLVALWDRIAFHRETQAGRRIELVAQALPVFEQLAELQAKKAIEPEQAELLKRQLMAGADKFIRAGVITTDIIVSHAELQPRKLLAPEQKLLTAGPDEGAVIDAEPSVPPESTAKRQRAKNIDVEDVVRRVVEQMQRDDAAEDE
jgi:hypothetical protein